jgi:hypothetical protein
MGTAKGTTGKITIDTLGSDYAMLAGNVVAIFAGGLICVLVSYMNPQNYNWTDMRDIPLGACAPPADGKTQPGFVCVGGGGATPGVGAAAGALGGQGKAPCVARGTAAPGPSARLQGARMDGWSDARGGRAPRSRANRPASRSQSRAWFDPPSSPHTPCSRGRP